MYKYTDKMNGLHISWMWKCGHSLVIVLWRSSYGHTATLLCPYDPLPEQLTGHYSHPRNKTKHLSGRTIY